MLRDLQRQHQLAVVVVHHAKKGGGTLRAGQALRGSSDFHAWGDSMLYLRRHGERVTLSVEHRAAPGIEAVGLELRAGDNRLALELIEAPVAAAAAPVLPVPTRILAVLAAAPTPLALGPLRAACRVRKATLCQALAELTTQGEIRKASGRYTLAGR